MSGCKIVDSPDAEQSSDFCLTNAMTGMDHTSDMNGKRSISSCRHDTTKEEMSVEAVRFKDELIVTGSRIAISHQERNGGVDMPVSRADDIIDDDDEEDGELEEYFAFDNSSSSVIIGEGVSAENTSTSSIAAAVTVRLDSCSPTTTQREEVVSSLFDAVWPQVVEDLAPLIERVVHLGPVVSSMRYEFTIAHNQSHSHAQNGFENGLGEESGGGYYAEGDYDGVW